MSEQTAVTKEDVREIIREEMTLARERRMEQMHAKEEERKANGVQTKLYLVTFGHRAMAIVDQHGRAIFTDCAFARVPIDENGKPSQYLGTMTVVAHGDGRLLKNPLNIVASGVQGYCEVPDTVLLPEE